MKNMMDSYADLSSYSTCAGYSAVTVRSGSINNGDLPLHLKALTGIFNEHEATAGVIVKEDNKTFLVLSDQDNRTYRFQIQDGLRNKLAREMVNLSL